LVVAIVINVLLDENAVKESEEREEIREERCRNVQPYRGRY